MRIQILGGGCANCSKLENNTRKALEALGVDASIEKVTDYSSIMALGVMRTPTLLVDGTPLVTGRVAKTREIQKLLMSRL